MRKWSVPLLSAILLWGCSDIQRQKHTTSLVRDAAPGLISQDAYTLVGARHLIHDYNPINADGSINVVVEIPAGTTAKWEVSKDDGSLQWEFKHGKPRVVQYLGYPGNYGMIPRTILAKEAGGDGDPLDVLVLGESVPRGSIVKAKVLGVLKFLDDGEQDDKIIAALEGAPFYELDTINELDTRYPGVSTIVETWFANYKGPGEMEYLGKGNVNEANTIVRVAAGQL